MTQTHDVSKVSIGPRPTAFERYILAPFGGVTRLTEEVLRFHLAFRSGIRVWLQAHEAAATNLSVILRSGVVYSSVTFRDLDLISLFAKNHSEHLPVWHSDGPDVVTFNAPSTNGPILVEMIWPRNEGELGIFPRHDYSWLTVRDHEVVDIGASIGDSAIYFALAGASHVIAVEPFTQAFQVARKNVYANKLGGVISLCRVAIAGSRGRTQLPEHQAGTVAVRASESHGDLDTDLLTLEDLTDALSDPQARLKIDCEGDEYDILFSTNRQTLRRYARILIEYHYGGSVLKRHLRAAGFKVRGFPPFRYLRDPDPNHAFGLLYCDRQ